MAVEGLETGKHNNEVGTPSHFIQRIWAEKKEEKNIKGLPVHQRSRQALWWWLNKKKENL